MRVAMIGTGYVGLVSGACFADFGHTVVCVDNDPAKIARLDRGEIPLFEPGLAELVERNVHEGRLSFAGDYAKALEGAEVVFIAVGTPSRAGSGAADLSNVHAAAATIARLIQAFTVIVVKSTVPVGAGSEIERIVRQHRPDGDFVVVSNPEFLREGAAIDDFKRPDRVVIGLDDERARPAMEELYRPLILNETPILFVDRRTAELIKYAANGFLAMKVTYINEIADLCEKVGADVQQVARGIGLDNRIGARFLHAGPGFGGSCFPKDTVALAQIGQAHDSPLHLIEATVAVNERRKRGMAARVIAACGGDVKGKTVAVLGLAFKPNTDDMRDAPSIPIIEELQKAGARIRAHDPASMDQARAVLSNVVYAESPYEAAEDADALVLVTEWDAYGVLDFSRLKRVMKTPVLVDLRNVHRGRDVARQGFRYYGVGQGAGSTGQV